jgi:hypothetical protein
VSIQTIAIVAGAYALMLALILSLLAASKRGEQESQRAVDRARAERARTRKEERRDVA